MRYVRFLAYLVAALVLATTAFGQGGSIPTNVPQTLTAPISVGSTGVAIPFNVSGCSGIRLDVIVPVNNSSFNLLNSSGQSVLVSGGPSVDFMLGLDIQPFPAPTVKTAAIATVFCRSQYQAGIAIERTQFVTGEDVSVGLLVLNGNQPATGLSPSIMIGVKNNPASNMTLVGRDDGINPDGVANDGIYSVDYTFTQAGVYNISGTVNIPTPGGIVMKIANTTVTVTDPSLQVAQITTSNSTGAGGCITAVNMVINMNVVRAGDFVGMAVLRASNNKTVTARTTSTLALGSRSILISFPTELLRSLGANSPYTVSLVDVEELLNNSFTLAFKRVNAAITGAVNLSQLCAAPIEVADGMTTTIDQQNGFISSLGLTFPLLVQSSGTYAISFKLIGAQGQDLGVFGDSRFISAGAPVMLTYTIPANTFLIADGPYSMISLLVTGVGNSAQLSQVGSTPSLQRWQFLPLINGDLDNDGDVDEADRALQSTFRNQTALSPGDRRDINRDGRIDILDLRAIQALACKAGTCPPFKLPPGVVTPPGDHPLKP